MYSLLHHNTFGIDARCDDFREYYRPEQLRALLSEMRGRRWLHIGSGSNLLFVNDFNGLILHSAIKGREVVKEDDDSVWLRVGAGENWDELVAWCVESGYYGLENLSLIPGEVGASAVQNIGAYGAEAGQFIDLVETIDTASGEERVFKQEECHYAYRSSIFKHEAKGKYVVTYVTYRLSKKFAPDLEYGAVRRELEARHIKPADVTAKMLRDLIIEVRRNKLPEPKETGSAGSFFMNPVVSEDVFNDLYAKYPNMPHYAMPGGGVKIPAGWMIEQCGWKGKALGRAGVWAKQALVLVNLGGATGEDIVRLSDAVRADVKEKFGIEIFPEVNFIE